MSRELMITLVILMKPVQSFSFDTSDHDWLFVLSKDYNHIWELVSFLLNFSAGSIFGHLLLAFCFVLD